MFDVPFKPKAYHSLTPYLIIKGAAEAIDYYTKAFDGKEVMRLDMPGGIIGHAEVRIGDSIVMMADEFPELDYLGPKSIGGSGSSLMIYTKDADAMFNKAVELGAKVLKPLADQFYGDRMGMLEDPFGHKWSIATHIEDVTPEQVKERMAKMCPPAVE